MTVKTNPYHLIHVTHFLNKKLTNNSCFNAGYVALGPREADSQTIPYLLYSGGCSRSLTDLGMPKVSLPPVLNTSVITSRIFIEEFRINDYNKILKYEKGS